VSPTLLGPGKGNRAISKLSATARLHDVALEGVGAIAVLAKARATVEAGSCAYGSGGGRPRSAPLSVTFAETQAPGA